jgi:hypothetical protein
VSVSPEYGELLAHLRDARAALITAASTLDLIGPGDPRPGALDDLIEDIQAAARLIGRRLDPNADEANDERQEASDRG